MTTEQKPKWTDEQYAAAQQIMAENAQQVAWNTAGPSPLDNICESIAKRAFKFVRDRSSLYGRPIDQWRDVETWIQHRTPADMPYDVPLVSQLDRIEKATVGWICSYCSKRDLKMSAVHDHEKVCPKNPFLKELEHLREALDKERKDHANTKVHLHNAPEVERLRLAANYEADATLIAMRGLRSEALGMMKLAEHLRLNHDTVIPGKVAGVKPAGDGGSSAQATPPLPDPTQHADVHVKLDAIAKKLNEPFNVKFHLTWDDIEGKMKNLASAKHGMRALKKEVEGKDAALKQMSDANSALTIEIQRLNAQMGLRQATMPSLHVNELARQMLFLFRNRAQKNGRGFWTNWDDAAQWVRDAWIECAQLAVATAPSNAWSKEKPKDGLCVVVEPNRRGTGDGIYLVNASHDTISWRAGTLFMSIAEPKA